VYAPDPLPATFPPEVAEAELPTEILPVEGFAKLAEFWSTMGAHHRWQPAVALLMRLPTVVHIETTNPMITTRITDDYQIGNPT